MSSSMRMQGLALLVSSMAAVGANAQSVSFAGTFSGTVQADQLPLGFDPPHPESFWDGAAVSGSFAVTLADPQYQFGADPFVGFTDALGTLRLTYQINGQTFQYDATPSIQLGQNGNSQTVDFLTSFQPKYDGGGVSFAGAGLFSNFDPMSIVLGPGAVFATSFADPGAEMRFSVQVDKASFGPVSAVPEPSTFALFGLGALGVLGVLASRGGALTTRRPRSSR